MATNTGFVITNAGNAVATTATPAGPFIHITEFRVGSGVNYTPVGSDTALHGTTLYTGGITNYYVVASDTVELICFMDATIGPFDFGEIGIYLNDGTLFALAAFDVLQNKMRAVGNQAGTQWRIRARIKLADAAVLCQVDVITSNQVLEVATWPLLVTPANQVGNANMAIVLEPTPSGDSVLVFKDTADSWGINDFVEVYRGNTSSPGTTIGTSVVAADDLPTGYFVLPQTVSRYLVKFPDGDIRKVVSSPGTGQLTFSPAKAVTQTGEFIIYEDANTACCRARWASRYEYNAFVAEFNPLWEVPSGTYSANNEGLNQTPLVTLSAPALPLPSHWTTLYNAVLAKCKIHQVPFADIENSDYSYCENNSNGYGLKHISDLFSALIAKPALLITNRNTADPAYQDVSVPPTGTVVRTTRWSGLKTHTVTFTYTDANTFKGLVNGGHELSFSASVLTGADANWLGFKSFLSSIGTVTVKRGNTISSGAGVGTSIGLYQLTGVYQAMFSHSGFIVGGAVVYAISGRITSGNIVDIKIEITNTAGGAYGGLPDDTFTSATSMRKPSSAVILTPVLAFPTVASVTDL